MWKKVLFIAAIAAVVTVIVLKIRTAIGLA